MEGWSHHQTLHDFEIFYGGSSSEMVLVFYLNIIAHLAIVNYTKIFRDVLNTAIKKSTLENPHCINCYLMNPSLF